MEKNKIRLIAHINTKFDSGWIKDLNVKKKKTFTLLEEYTENADYLQKISN